MAMYAISYQPQAIAELNELRAFDRVRVLDAVEKSLREVPTSARAKRKRIDLGGGDFIWQLRVGDHRVFYDVFEEERLIVVRYVRLKGRKTTGEIL